MRRFRFIFVSLLLALIYCSSVSAQTQKSSFWQRFSTYEKQLFKDVDGTKAKIENLAAHVSQDDDSSKLIYNLILFDASEMYNDVANIKKYGMKLKSMEILFDDFKLKLLIATRYQEMLYFLNDEVAFEDNLYPYLRLAKQKRAYSDLASLYIITARFKANLNQRDSALYYMNAALSTVRKQTDKWKLASIVLGQAIVYKQFKSDDIAMSKAFVGLQLSTENDYKWGIFIANYLLAGINQRHQNNVEMLRNLHQAKKMAELIHFQQGKQLMDLFELQSKRKFDVADKQKLKAIQESVSQDDASMQGKISETWGLINQSEHKYNDAFRDFNLAIVEFEKLGDRYNIQQIYQFLAEILISQKKYDKALVYLNRSADILKSMNDLAESNALLKKMSDVYNLMGNEAMAYAFLERYVKQQDSMQLANVQSNLILLQQQSLADAREHLITLQSDSIKAQQQEKAYTTTMLENIKLKNNLKTYIIIGFVGLVLLGGIILFFKWNQNLIEQHQREAEMNQTLLRTQMNPHFVFNAMSVIQSYIYDNDTKNSTKFLVNFSKLMRLILENSSKEFIPMEIEIEILQKYLSVQKLRFEDRFTFDIHTDEELLAEELMIPPMITQPFIENAIEHGQLHLREDGFIHISFRKLDDKLMEIHVEDNGIGRENAINASNKSKDHKSMAIGITKDRITTLSRKYKTEGSLVFEDFDKENKTGTVVTIKIPYSHKKL